MKTTTCPLCDVSNASVEYYPNEEPNLGIKVLCENCRDFIADSGALSKLQGAYKNRRHILSALSRDRHAKGLPPLEITGMNLEELVI